MRTKGKEPLSGSDDDHTPLSGAPAWVRPVAIDSQNHRNQPPAVIDERVMSGLTLDAIALTHSDRAGTVTEWKA